MESGADLGLAFDGDADRMLAVDENGLLIDGDRIMAVCGLDMKERGELAGDTIVGTVMSNLGLHIALEQRGIKLETTKVGDRYVLERMLEAHYKIGGEQSGHVIFLDYNTTGDGVLSGLMLCQVMVRKGAKLSTLASVMRPLPQVLVNVDVSPRQREAYPGDPELAGLIAEVEAQLGNRGRVLILLVRHRAKGAGDDRGRGSGADRGVCPAHREKNSCPVTGDTAPPAGIACTGRGIFYGGQGTHAPGTAGRGKATGGKRPRARAAQPLGNAPHGAGHGGGAQAALLLRRYPSLDGTEAGNAGGACARRNGAGPRPIPGAGQSGLVYRRESAWRYWRWYGGCKPSIPPRPRPW